MGVRLNQNEGNPEGVVSKINSSGVLMGVRLRLKLGETGTSDMLC